VLGVHGRGSLEARYGSEAETLLSTPRTKVFLRTREPRAAEWISEALAEAGGEHRHKRQSARVPWLTGAVRRSDIDDRARSRPLLVPSATIMTLPDFEGYLTSRQLVIRARLAPVVPEPRQPALLPRPMKTLELQPAEPPPAAAALPEPDRDAEPAIEIFESRC
jgi:type IV secretory pathway TraG/TraD family ATPase VirD4